MLHRGLLLIIALLIRALGFSQTTYPKAVTLGTDHVIAITTEQMDSINRLFIWNDQLRSQDSLLHTKLDSCYIAFKLFHHSDSVQAIEIRLRDTVIAKQGTLIHDQGKLITKLRIQKGFIATIGVAVSGFLLYLLITK